MKILHAITHLDPRKGGPPVVAAQLAAAQANLGHEVALVSQPPERDQLSVFQQFLSSVPGLESVEVRELAWSPKRFLSEDWRTALRADFVHLHGLWDPFTLLTANALISSQIPYCVATHGVLNPWSFSYHGFQKKLALRTVYRRVLNKSAFVHALTQDEASEIRKREPKIRTKVIPNGVFRQQTRGPGDPSTLPLHTRPYVLFLGRLHHIKGLDYLARAFALVCEQTADLDLLVAGPNDTGAPEFERLVQSLGISDRVVLLGPLYGFDKQSALDHAVCLCQPSREECFSMTVLEALSRRTPIVVSEHAHFPEVEEVGAGNVVPLSPEAISKAIVRIHRLPQAERRRMGDAGAQLVLERFTWEAVAKQALDVYRHMGS